VKHRHRARNPCCSRAQIPIVNGVIFLTTNIITPEDRYSAGYPIRAIPPGVWALADCTGTTRRRVHRRKYFIQTFFVPTPSRCLPAQPLDIGGKCSNIFCTHLSRFLMFLFALLETVSLADPRQISILVRASNRSITRVPTS
jgi:hypothetical protein